VRAVLAMTAVGALGVLTCADARANAEASARGGVQGEVQGDARAGKREILMRSVSFGPREVTVTVGDTVVWRNADIVRHNAVRREVFDTGELQPGEQYAWVPADTGTYRYQCTIHERMRGRLTVKRPK
jgi:plastocyanin